MIQKTNFGYLIFIDAVSEKSTLVNHTMRADWTSYYDIITPRNFSPFTSKTVFLVYIKSYLATTLVVLPNHKQEILEAFKFVYYISIQDKFIRTSVTHLRLQNL